MLPPAVVAGGGCSYSGLQCTGVKQLPGDELDGVGAQSGPHRYAGCPWECCEAGRQCQLLLYVGFEVLGLRRTSAEAKLMKLIYLPIGHWMTCSNAFIASAATRNMPAVGLGTHWMDPIMIKNFCSLLYRSAIDEGNEQ